MILVKFELEFIFLMFVSIEELCVMNNVVDFVEVDDIVGIEGVLNFFNFYNIVDFNRVYDVIYCM